MKKAFANIIAVILCISTFPISIVVYGVAYTETFIGDPIPKYVDIWNNFLTLPFKLFKIK